MKESEDSPSDDYTAKPDGEQDGTDDTGQFGDDSTQESSVQELSCSTNEMHCDVSE